QEGRVLSEQGVGALDPAVRLPLRLPETAPHGLAVEIEAPRDLGDRDALPEQPVDLRPAILPNHPHLPRLLEPGAQGADARCVVNQCHHHPPRVRRVATFRLPPVRRIALPLTTRGRNRSSPWSRPASRLARADRASSAVRPLAATRPPPP